MPSLGTDHKRLIVQRLATFVTPTEIQEELRGFGVEVSLRQVVYYDPAAKGSELAEEWRALHAETRRRFVEETSDIAISHKSFRLRELERLYRKASSGQRPNIPLAKDLLEQASKESGGVFTNRRELTGKDGDQLIPAPSLDDLSDADLAAMAARLAKQGEQG